MSPEIDDARRTLAAIDSNLDELRIPRMRCNRIPRYSDTAGFGVLVPLPQRHGHDGGSAA